MAVCNMQAVSCDTAAVAAAAAGVAVVGGILLATGALFWIDPAVAFAIAIAIVIAWGITQCNCSLSLPQPDAHPVLSPWARPHCVARRTTTEAV